MALTFTWDQYTAGQPADGESPRYVDDKIRETRGLVEERLGREHLLVAGGVYDTNANQGYHRPGSAIAYYSGSAPTNLPDGQDALADNSLSNGRLWFDTDDDRLLVYKAGSWTIAGAKAYSFDQAVKVFGLAGVTVASWNSDFAALEAFRSSIAFRLSTSARIVLLTNAYLTGDDTAKYKAAGTASRLQIDGRTLTFRSAPSGSADANITWSDRFIVSDSGRVKAYGGHEPLVTVHAGTMTENALFDALKVAVPATGDKAVVVGSFAPTNSTDYTWHPSYMERMSSTQIRVYFMEFTPGFSRSAGYDNLDDGSSLTYYDISLAVL